MCVFSVFAEKPATVSLMKMVAQGCSNCSHAVRRGVPDSASSARVDCAMLRSIASGHSQAVAGENPAQVNASVRNCLVITRWIWSAASASVHCPIPRGRVICFACLLSRSCSQGAPQVAGVSDVCRRSRACPFPPSNAWRSSKGYAPALLVLPGR